MNYVKPTILFTEDELALAEIVKESLEAKGFEVRHVQSAAETLTEYYARKPQLLILDVMLSGESGFDIAKKIRSTDIDTPILFLTARSMPEDVVAGFEHGGNDYLKKPFSLAELVIRIKALLNKNRLAINTEIGLTEMQVGKYSFYYTQRSLQLTGKNRELTFKEAEVLKLLIINRNNIIERKTLLMNIWGNDDFFTGRSLDVFITKLRKYLEGDTSVKILNIRGIGYKLIF